MLVEDVLRKGYVVWCIPLLVQEYVADKKAFETDQIGKLYKKRGDWCYWRSTTWIRVFSINIRLLYLNHSKGE